MKIILGSGSPRRRELLAQTGYKFEILVSKADENIETKAPIEMVEELSYRKAEAVAKTLIGRQDREDYLVIGADTIVVYNEKILGKPADKEDAYKMMRVLSGQTHQVYTGVTFLLVKRGIIMHKEIIHERTDVDIREMSEEEITDYIENTNDWKDKAGGYGIQTSFGAKFIPAIRGDFYNVVGLPTCAVGMKIEELLHKKITVADAYKAAGHPVEQLCGGNGVCKKCKAPIRLYGEEREVLACQTPFTNSMELVLGEEEEEELPAQILTESVDPLPVEREVNIHQTGLGVAVDIGTTTVAAYLYNLAGGARLAVSSAMNKQIVHGGDIISRIQYAKDESGLRELHTEIIDTINGLIDELCKEARKTSEEVTKVALCGNSTMQHLFMGWSPEKLGKSPYVNVNENMIQMTGQESELHCKVDAEVTFLPLMGRFVGADTLSCLLTFPKDDKTRLLIDLGTNGELALGNEKDSYLFTSAACGPALEGGKIVCGMRGTTGAVEKVKFEKGKVLCQTIGNVNPTGICGSGIISLISALLDEGILTKEGRLLSKKEFLKAYPGNPLATRIREVGPNNLAFFLVRGSHPVYLCQRDIREIQIAKSSIHAGCMTLIEQKEMTLQDIDEVILAGAFGNYIDVNDAINVGLIPAVPKEKIKSIGNGAGMGVQQYLFEPELAERADKIKTNATHVALTRLDTFRDKYISGMNF